MKTLVEKATNISVFIFPDNETVDMSGNAIAMSGGAFPWTITDAKCRPSLMTLHENLGVKTDWASRKYKYDGSAWTLNSDFAMADLECPLCGTSISMPAKKCSNSDCDFVL